MRYKQIIVLFNHMISIKESYIIAMGGETNPYIIARFIETFLTIMNPITPHFCQHVWQDKVYPIVNQNGSKKEILMTNGWPEAGTRCYFKGWGCSSSGKISHWEFP